LIDPSPAFLALLAGDEEALELDQAALEVATLDRPGLDPGGVLRILDTWAAAINSRLSPSAGGAHFLSTVNRFLFEETGLGGDIEDYYAPANSCLDQVLERRKGLPLTLSVIYLEIARRLLRPVYGIPLPAHFLCQYNDGLVKVYIDVFDGGRLLTEDDCLDLIEKLTNRRLESTPLLFAPATKRQVVARMLNNLFSAYRRLGDLRKAEDAERWLRLAYPGAV
jgi:regulator of sirC expression with transglutaminase-like and TPR domain